MSKTESKLKTEFEARRGLLRIVDGGEVHYLAPERIIEVTGYDEGGDPLVDVYVEGIEEPLTLHTTNLDDMVDAWAASRRLPHKSGR